MFSLDYSTVRTLSRKGSVDLTLAISRRSGRLVLIERLEGFNWQSRRLLRSVRSLLRKFQQVEALGLARIEAIDVTSTTVAIVYEYVEGMSLTEFLTCCDQLSSEELLRFAAQLLATLGDLHETGFYHGMLTGEKVIVSSSHAPFLTRYGTRFVKDVDRKLTGPDQDLRLEALRRRRVGEDLMALGDLLDRLRTAWEVGGRSGAPAAERGTSRLAPVPLSQVASRLREGRYATASQALADLIQTPSEERKVVADRYELRELLGRGSVGEVFSAYDRVLQHPVALKMLREDIASDARNMRRLRTEINLARQIRHPNVVATYDLGEADGVRFITMELIDGASLNQVVRRQYPEGLPVEVGLPWFIQVLEGLGAAHAQQVIHRDIKPDNILIDRRGHAHLVDFGIALSTEAGRITDNGVVLGTPIYMSPEQFRGEPVTPATDLYALGVTIYEALSRAFPYDAENIVSLALKKLEEKPVPLRARRREVPASVEAVVMRALQPRPEDRYANAADMAEAFRTLL